MVKDVAPVEEKGMGGIFQRFYAALFAAEPQQVGAFPSLIGQPLYGCGIVSSLTKAG